MIMLLRSLDFRGLEVIPDSISIIDTKAEEQALGALKVLQDYPYS